MLTKSKPESEMNQTLLKVLNDRLEELQTEYEFITKTMANFAHLLRVNSILPYTDAYESYISFFIDRWVRSNINTSYTDALFS